MSNNQKQQEGRPKLTDQEACAMQFGQFIQFLQSNGIPSPSIAEQRLLLYSTLYVEFQRQVRDFQDTELEKLRNKLPQVQQALQAQEASKHPVQATKSPVVEAEPVDGIKEVKSTGDDEIVDNVVEFKKED